MRPEINVTNTVGPAAGRELAAAIEQVVAGRGRCRLALSGGSAPVPVLQWLAEHLPPALLGALVITWIDERHLPLSSVPSPGGSARGGSAADWRALPEHSNVRLAWEHWLSRLAPSTVPALVPMARPEALPDAAQRYAEEFAATLGGLDVVLLGVGPDGHIASLFPDHPALQATGVCVAVDDSPKPPPQRLTLTLPVLEDVDHAVLVATGAAKASVLRRAHAGDAAIPLGRYRPRGTWRWILDPEAAAELPPPHTKKPSSSSPEST